MTIAELQFVGGGKMGEALVAGLLAAGHEPSTLRIVEIDETRAGELRARFAGVEVTHEPAESVGTVLAVKPQYVESAAQAASASGAARVLSIAAGVRLATIEAAVSVGTPVVRAMPNTPALVGAGAAAISPGRSATDGDLDWAESVLGAVGSVVRVPEQLLDAVTGLSGSGPAYVFLFLEAMIDGGVAAGLPRDVAAALAGQTVAGAARLFTETGQSAAELRAAVTSPGGTTAAGVRELEAAAVRAAVIDAVAAATARSRELGS